jgi:hypothetical protein
MIVISMFRIPIAASLLTSGFQLLRTVLRTVQTNRPQKTVLLGLHILQEAVSTRYDMIMSLAADGKPR